MPSDPNGWRLLDFDPVTGAKTWFLALDDGRIAIREETPVDDLFARNAELQANSVSKRWGNGQVAASIPLDVFYQQLAEPVRQGDQRYIARWLNDSDHSKFRTFKGRV